MKTSQHPIKRCLPALLALAAAFAAGWAGGGGTLFATSVNKGLVTAFNSVGQELFGEAVFNAAPPDPVHPTDPMRLFFADNSQIPTAFEVFTPDGPPSAPSPCHTYLEVEVTPSGVVVMYDPARIPAGFSTDMMPALLSDRVPKTAQCAAPPT